jgi:ABC-type glycerol-3-phosphate transport system substrate-binding protein
VCAVSLLASACGGGAGGSSAASGSNASSGGKTTVTFVNWATTEQGTKVPIHKAIARFEKTHPKIKIKNVGVSFSNIEHKTLLQARSGNPPDVVEMAGNYTLSLADASLLKPLDSFAKSSFKNKIIKRELKVGVINGKLKAIPWTVDPFELWYNKKLLHKAGITKPPQTMKQLLSDLKMIKAKESGVIPMGIDTTNREIALAANWSFMRSFGAQPFHGSKATADTPAMARYLKFMRTLGHQNYTLINHKAGDFRSNAANNQLVFSWDGPYFRGHVKSIGNISEQQFEQTWGVTELPSGPAGGHYSVPTDHQLVMLKSAKHPKAAWTFMKWLTTSPWAVQHYTLPAESSPPPLAHPGAKVSKLLDNQYSQTTINKVVPDVVRPPWGKDYSQVYAPIMASVQKAMTGNAPVGQIAKEMQSEVKSGLQ